MSTTYQRSTSPHGGTGAEARLRDVPWEALSGLADALEPALAAVLRGSPAERVLDRLLREHRHLGAAGRRAFAEAVFGVGLWRRRLAWHAGLPDDAPGAWAAQPRLLLAALVRDLAGRPPGEAEALCGLAPGALGPARPPPADLARRASLPDWLADALRKEVGPEAAALADALGRPGPVALRTNPLRTTPEALAARLAAEGVDTRPGTVAPGALVVTSPRPNPYGLAAWREGLFEIQDEASQLVGWLVGARPGEAVLDLCAGAGGKTLQLAAAVAPGGEVHAADPDAERLARLRPRAARAGAVELVRVHGAEPPAALQVDRALVDAPCSELGALRRGPDLRHRLEPGAFAALPALQLELLARAAAHLRPGGRLVYATCTFRRAEDEAVALAFERAHPEFARLAPDVPSAPRTGDGFVRTWPHRQGCDAFFAALWQRRSP